MSNFTFTLNGQTFSIKAPAGTTEEQAQALFKQQADTGSLVGIKVGDGLSAATQAAGGLIGAASQLAQQAGSLTGSLPVGTNLNSITASLGPAAAAAGSQVSAALAGGSAAFNSLTTAASGATAAVSRALNGTNSAGPGLTSALTGFAASAGSLATQTVDRLKGAIGGAATNGINVADFVKQGPALSGLGNMKLPDVTGTLAQASKLVGQGAATISNALGAGKFGFDASQLERAGLVKPGTAAAFLAQGANDLVSVLKSPTVWTGKDGVKGLDGLLKNPGLQDKVQQGLMKTGLDDLKSLGVPTDKLNPQALSGLATNAAKSVTDTVAWAKNSAGLPADVKAKFDSAAVSGAFAVNLAKNKIDAPVLQETKPVAAADTVNSATVDAAGQRVVGNDKVPSVSTAGDGIYAAASAKIKAKLSFSDQIYEGFKALEPIVNDYEAAASITLSQWETLNSELNVVRATFNARAQELADAAYAAVEALPDGSKKNSYTLALNKSNDVNASLREYAKILIKRIKDLANKIAASATA